MANELTTSEKQADILSQALPYMQKYEGETIVIKYGGHAMGDAELGKAFCRDIALLKQSGVNPIVVHGGGPQIGAMLKKMGIESEFKNGLRVTDKDTVEVVEMVLAGSVNKQIVAAVNAQGAKAIGLCGKDGNLVLAKKSDADLGFVGEPKQVDTHVLDAIISGGIIPIIAPVCFGEDGETYNVNADTFAGAIAGAMDAKRLLFLTDVPGVMDKDKVFQKDLSVKRAKEMIQDGTIAGGMIPKVETCINAIDKGVEGVVILNGKVSHAVLLELFTEHGAGTLIVNNQ